MVSYSIVYVNLPWQQLTVFTCRFVCTCQYLCFFEVDNLVSTQREAKEITV